MTTVAIMQPTYLPWAGYFDMLDQADVFVLLDTVAVSPKSWQTRNRIRARDGNVVWLSVPTHTHRGVRISDVEIANNGWQAKHLRTVTAAYGGHAPCFSYVSDIVGPAIEDWYWGKLAGYTGYLIESLAARLGISTSIIYATTLGMDTLLNNPYERVADICRVLGATELLNTPGAKDWLDGHDVGVPVRWHEYEHPVYSQGDAPFMPYLSVVDLLAWHGPDSLGIIRSGRL